MNNSRDIIRNASRTGEGINFDVKKDWMEQCRREGKRMGRVIDKEIEKEWIKDTKRHKESANKR